MEFRDIREKMVTEAKSKGKTQDPPAVIMLRRTGVRIFPSGEKVALYRNEKLNLTFSVPYTEKGYGSPVTANEEALNEDVITEEMTAVQRLAIINRNKEIGEVVFDNGAKAKVDATSAGAILRLLDQLTPANKQKATKTINGSLSGMSRIRDFAFKNLQD